MNRLGVNAYAVLMIGGILLTALVWGRLTRRGERVDGRLTLIYFWALIGALLGAKISFLFAEGWHYRHDWLALLSGRSITGGLLGGYLAVEIGKRRLHYRTTTGDLFAIIAPLGLLLGRIGCLMQGCCPGVECEPQWWTIADHAGVPRWPAAAVELGFNAAFLAWVLPAARLNWQNGNRFHIYLIAYGLFRFAHEFARADALWTGPVSGYHFLATLIFGFGLLRYMQRRRDDRPRLEFAPSTPTALRVSRKSSAAGSSG